jgi:4-oxalocrotonate tautomerase
MFEGRSQEQKQALVTALTEATVKSLGSKPEAVEIVLSEVKKSNWASGGVFWSDKK